MEKEGFVYIWYDKKHERYYIGCHWGTEDDGYICSSSWMRNSYKRRPHDFKRRIIQRNILRENLMAEEHRWLIMIPKDELGKKYYNLHNHHFGHWSIDNRTHMSVCEKLSEASKRLHQNPEYKEKYMEGRKKMPPQTQEQIEKRAKANTGQKRTEETKRKISQSNKGKILGPLSDEHRRKVSESLMGEKNPFYGKKHDPELMKQISFKISKTKKGKRPKNFEKNIESFVGSFWWNNGTINKRSKTCPGNNWVKGCIQKKANIEK
jgi:hypothetical protein